MQTIQVIVLGLISCSCAFQYDKVIVDWGEDVVLSCPYEGEQTDFTWYLGITPTEDNVIARTLADGSGQEILPPLHQAIASLTRITGDLTIKRTRFSDQSWYTCSAGGHIYHKSLVVNSVSSVSDVKSYSSQSQVGPSKPNVTFTCEYGGISANHQVGLLIWYFNDMEMFTYNTITNRGQVDSTYDGRIDWQTPSNEAMTMVLIGATFCDVGIYTCAVFDTEDKPHRSTDTIRLGAGTTKGTKHSTQNPQNRDAEMKVTDVHDNQMIQPEKCSNQRSLTPVDRRMVLGAANNAKFIGLLLFLVGVVATATMLLIWRIKTRSHKPKVAIITRSPIFLPDSERGIDHLGRKYKMVPGESLMWKMTD